MRGRPIELPAEARRVLGCLVEKAMATPDQYPLSINALRTACNQRTGRDPVTDYDEADVRAGLDALKEQQLVRAEYARGSRVPRYAHRLAEQLDLDDAGAAVLAVLLLRGPQTVGELRQRAERMHAFEDLPAVGRTLTALAGHRFGALAAELPRGPGQKEARWRHLLGGDEAPAPAGDPSGHGTATSAPARQSEEDLRSLVTELRAEVESLRAEVDAIRSTLGR